jgi:ParB-like chromosome segregation protein Spo0J
LLQEIPLDRLVAHPENSNHMSAEILVKLRRHIETSQRYEPLTVRPHPSVEGKYEVLNGHNRLHVLRAIGCEAARCLVWEVDDAQARLYLATLNRLSGSDVPERRAALLDSLFGDFDASALLKLLPDDKRQLEELRRLSRLEPEEVMTAETACGEKAPIPVILDFVLEESAAREVNLALDMIRASAEEKIAAGQALVRLARFYLDRCQAS